MKRLIAEMELEHPDIKHSMIKALGNVAPRHLLDRALVSNKANREVREGPAETTAIDR